MSTIASVTAPRIYWDATAGLPCSAAALQAFGAGASEGWADPRRIHSEGRHARALLDGARAHLANTLGCQPDEVFFLPDYPSALRAAFAGCASPHRQREFLHTAIDNAVTLDWAARHPATQIPLLSTGAIDLEGLAGMLRVRGKDAVVTCQSANPEIGTSQPLTQIWALTQEHDQTLIVDAGPTYADAVPQHWDVLVIDPRGWGSVPGVGVLAARRKSVWRSEQAGLGAAGSSTMGSTSLPAIPSVFAAAISAAEALAHTAAADAARRPVIASLRDRLPGLVSDLEMVGDPDDRLPHVLTFSCLYVDGEALAGELDKAGFAIGSGSACLSDGQPSHVLAALGALTHGNVRIGLPPTTPAAQLQEQADLFCQVLPGIVANLRAMTGASDL